jgi:SET and MYND domain-containing protein 4
MENLLISKKNGKYKSSEKSKHHLEEGKKFFERSKHFEALINLNRGLCFAENSFEISLCHEVRARVYFSIDQHQKCLRNIRKAREYESSSNLLDLEVECMKLLKNEKRNVKTSSDFFKLSYPPNNKNPSIINRLQIKLDDKFGRHIVTTQRLNSGDIVAIEDPLLKTLNKTITQGRCFNCLKANLLDLLPCNSCTSVMFCSEECKKVSWGNFHKFECCSIDDMTEDDSFLMMIQRSLFEMISICGNLENLQNLVDENPTPITAFDFDMNACNSQDLKKKLILVYQSLECAAATNDDLRFAKSFVNYHEHVKNFWKTEEQREFLIKFVVKFIGTMNRNAFKTHWTSPSTDVEEQGCAIFPTISMLSHSCSPNLFRIRVDGNFVLIARKPIEVNEQLFLSYQ